MLSLILPVRDWPLDRVEASLDSFLNLKSRHLTEVVVVDFGSRTRVKLKPRKGLSPKVVRVEADEWSLAEAINTGVLATTGKALAKIDADTLISPDSTAEFDLTAARIASGQLGLSVAQFIDFQQEVSLSHAVKSARQEGTSFSKRRPKWGQGALVFFGRVAWQEIGGFESRFTGWGNEDNDFYERMRFSGHRVDWTDRTRLKVYHVWHPPTYAKTGILAHRQKNIELAKSDKSILRPIRFVHSNARKVAAPAVVKGLHPLVSLGVATTHRPGRLKMIAEALNSFRGQINNDIEVIVVDNGSSAAEYRSLKSQMDRMSWPAAVKVERLDEASIPKARNIVTDLSRGRYLCVVDDDDIALPNRLADHLAVFERDGLLHGSHGGWIDFDEQSGVIERNQGKERTLATLLKGTGKVTCHPASLYRTDVLRKVRYDESFLLGSDWDLALRMAMMGLEIGHTRSFLTLRRFHATNVTITGQSNQVTRGLQARSRQAMALGWRETENLQDMAKAVNSEVYCPNTMTLEAIVSRLPAYVGEWCLFVPVAALGGKSPNRSDESDALAAVDQKLLQSIFDKVPGELCTRFPGVNKDIYFRSEAIKGSRKALSMKAAIEAMIDAPVELFSARQAALDRQARFNWHTMKIEQGHRLLRSVQFRDCTEALLARAKLAADPELRHVTSLVSDHDGEGECYYLLTAPYKGKSALQATQFRLRKAAGYDFVQLGSGAVESDLLPESRNH